MSIGINNVKPQTLEFVTTVGCVDQHAKIVKINKGLPLACKDWNELESALLRKRALTGGQLYQSGFARRVDRSSLHNNLRIKKRGIDVGPIRVQDSGARKLTECGYNFEAIEMESFEKRFYVVNTNKHIEFCARDVIGTVWADWVGDASSDYNYDKFQDSDFAELVVAAIIERYDMFTDKFLLLSVYGSEQTDQHGDDGVLAKAYYASKGQYFHTLQFDFSGLQAGKFIQLRQGGKTMKWERDNFSSLDELLIEVTEWINELKENRYYMYYTTLDTTTDKITVTSAFAVHKVRLEAVIDDGAPIDWGEEKCWSDNRVPTTCLQQNMMVNDTPLLFNYTEINQHNFDTLFKAYFKEFKRYLHRNGFESVTEDQIRIGIDPEILMEREDYIKNLIKDGKDPSIVNKLGLSMDKFVPLNALNDTGLFFMTINRNILLLGDDENIAGQAPSLGNFRSKEGENGQYQVMVDVPMGSAVEHFGLFAANLCDSPFVKDNDLDNRTPYENTRETILCYDDSARQNCITTATCSLSTSVDVEAAYDDVADETTFTVTVGSNQPEGTTLVYDLAYSFSEGTNQSGISSAAFTATLPGDQTNTGIVINVTGTVEAQDANSNTQCVSSLNYTKKFGEGSGLVYCTHSYEGNVGGFSDNIEVQYDILGASQAASFVDAGLNLTNEADHPAIEDEIEAIFPGSTATIETIDAGAGNYKITIENVPYYIDADSIIFFSGGANDLTLTTDC